MRLSPRLIAAIAACCVLTATACTSHHRSSAAASSDAGATALHQLREQAAKASTSSFTATYLAQGGSPERTDTVHVFRTPSAVRLDVEESGTTVRILADKSGTYSCKLTAGTAPLCVTLAGAGEQLSSSLAAQLQLALLFTTAASQLADGSGFDVRPAAAQSPTGSAPAATCFSIVKVPTDSDVAAGTYCFADGLLVSARYRTGSLQLTATGQSPTASDFSLPASPVPLPSGSAAPTPS